MLDSDQGDQHFACGFEGNLFLLFVPYDFRPIGIVTSQVLSDGNDLVGVADRASLCGIGQMFDCFQLRNAALRLDQPEFLRPSFLIELNPIVAGCGMSAGWLALMAAVHPGVRHAAVPGAILQRSQANERPARHRHHRHPAHHPLRGSGAGGSPGAPGRRPAIRADTER